MGDIPKKGKFCTMKAPWMSIIKGVNWFEERCKWNINDGENLSFWHGQWNEKNPLVKSFPRLYAICLLKDATILQMWDDHHKVWNFLPKRPLNDREQQTWNSIVEILPTLHPKNDNNSQLPMPKELFKILLKV